MLTYSDCSKNYKHEYFFKHKGTEYRVNSIVRLTDEAKSYLGSATKEVILKEVYYNHIIKKLCFKYEFKDIKLNIGIVDKTTDRTPDELIEEVVIEASVEYASREIFGMDSPHYKTGTKNNKKDWEIQEVMVGWVVFVLVFIAVAIFKDWYVRLIIRGAAGWIFGLYRKAYKDAYTTYTHDEDSEILKKKYEILYGIKSNKTQDTDKK